MKSKGTEFVMNELGFYGTFKPTSKKLQFINTKTGTSNEVSFKDDYYYNLEKIKQIRIDSLGINLIVVSAKTYHMGVASADKIAFKHIYVLSADGQEKTQLDDNGFYVTQWGINKQTGTITISGFMIRVRIINSTAMIKKKLEYII